MCDVSYTAYDLSSGRRVLVPDAFEQVKSVVQQVSSPHIAHGDVQQWLGIQTQRIGRTMYSRAG